MDGAKADGSLTYTRPKRQMRGRAVCSSYGGVGLVVYSVSQDARYETGSSGEILEKVANIQIRIMKTEIIGHG